MKKKQLILICSAVLFVLVAVFSILAVKGARGEKQTVPAASSVSRQISSESGSGAEKDSSAAPAQKEENSSAANRTAAGNEKEKNSNSQNAPQNPARETAAENTAGEAEKKETTQKQKITVTFSVTCKNALANGADVPQSGYIIGQTEITLKNGQTVFDALEAACDKNGVSLRYQSESYITEIGGLAEKDCGGASGWMYRVNGTNPRKAASKYVLKDGDTVEWYYVTSASDN